jgi:hypothetical protein
MLKGDYVLLVEKAGRWDGDVPVLCEVKGFWTIDLSSLCKAIRGNTKYPFIFFFNTERITLTWPEFRSHLGYAENFNPRGQFAHVRHDRLSKRGGVEAYIPYLRRRYGADSPSEPSRAFV